MITYWPVCDNPKCIRRPARDADDFLNPRRAFDAATPADGRFTYLVEDARIWLFACDVHHADTSEGVAVLELRRVRAQAEKYRPTPRAYAGTNWPWTHRLITQGVTVPVTPPTDAAAIWTSGRDARQEISA